MKIKKHAYLIMAHNNFYILDKLLRLLDDPRNDIYLHIDKKVKNFDFDGFRTVCKRSTVCYPKKRIRIQWGTQSQVQAEMLLFKTAYLHGPYHYYHLLSGVDLPLKTQDEIHSFFYEQTESFLLFNETPTNFDYQRVSRYHFFFKRKTIFSQRINSYIHLVQQKLNVDRVRRKRMLIKKGSNWASVNQDAVELLLQNQSEIKSLTRYSLCADELYKQTFLSVLGYENVVNDDLRYVDWSAGGNHPYVFRTNDFEALICSEKLFARKFDENTDKNIVDQIFEHIMKLQSNNLSM